MRYLSFALIDSERQFPTRCRRSRSRIQSSKAVIQQPLRAFLSHRSDDNTSDEKLDLYWSDDSTVFAQIAKVPKQEDTVRRDDGRAMIS